MEALYQTAFEFPGQTEVYHGKVRDVYSIGDQLVMVASDRISAFDHILPKAIPHKGQVLNQTAVWFLEATRDIVPNWLQASPDPNVAIGLRCAPIRVEMVIRAYLVGHAWREYSAGRRLLCGVPMPEGLRESDAFPEPIITPATKADEGHDEDISREDIISKGIVPEDIYLQLEAYTRALFARGSAMALARGLLLVDTKYEFGLHEGKVYLIDEVHTPDSSRYFIAEGYAARQARGERQQQLSKEFVREWLMAHGFQGLENQLMPMMPDSFVDEISKRYIGLYEQVTGQTFTYADTGAISERIYRNVMDYLASRPA
jgi:phosphoribosylaminoimidazole-succinocarboxamide synthase